MYYILDKKIYNNFSSKLDNFNKFDYIIRNIPQRQSAITLFLGGIVGSLYIIFIIINMIVNFIYYYIIV